MRRFCLAGIVMVASNLIIASCTDDSEGGPAPSGDASFDVTTSDGGANDAKSDASPVDSQVPQDSAANDSSTDGGFVDADLTFVSFTHNPLQVTTHTVAVNRVTGAVSPIDMDPSTQQVDGVPFGDGGTTSFTTVGTHDGKYFYSADRAGAMLYGFSQADTGHVTAIVGADGGTGLAACPDALLMAATPSNNHLLVRTSGGGVFSFAIDSATGRLTLVNSQPSAGGGYAIAVERQGKFAYATGLTNSMISAYSINAGTGALTRMSAGDAGVDISSGGGEPTYAIAHPTKDVLYVSNNSNGTIARFDIDAIGGLHPAGATAPATGAMGLAIDAIGQHLYVASGFGEVRVFTIDGTGALTVAPGATSPTNDAFGIAVDPIVPLLYVAGNAGFDTYKLPPSGAPQLVGSDNSFYGPSPGRVQVFVKAKP